MARIKQKATAEQEQEVLLLLEAVRGEYVPKDTLVNITKLNERIVRAALSQLAQGGQPIVSSPNQGGGYKISTDPEEIENEISQLSSRISVLRQRMSGLRKAQKAA